MLERTSEDITMPTPEATPETDALESALFDDAMKRKRAPGTPVQEPTERYADLRRSLEGRLSRVAGVLHWTSEAMRAVLCDPEDRMCFEGSDGDREIMRTALDKIDAELAALKEGK